MKNKKIIFVLMLLCIFIISMGLTYAFFDASVSGNDNAQDTDVTATNLGEIVFNDGNTINGSGIYPGWSLQKTFTISSSEDATENAYYAIMLEITSNTLTEFSEGAFKYYLSGTSTNGGTTALVADAIVPSDIGENLLSIDGVLTPNDTHTYTFTIEFEETNENQNSAQGKTFSGFLQIKPADNTKTLVWDNSANTWKSVVVTNENCFAFSYGTISSYYDNENNDVGQAICPRRVYIPDTIDSIPVTSIGDSAFYNKGLLDIILPKSLEAIDYRGFSSNKLASISIPESVIEIGDDAFSNNKLTKLSIPDNVLELGEAVFNNNNLSDEEAFIFNRDDSDDDGIAEVYNEYLISYAGAKKENVEIPNTVQYIGRYAFSGTNLESVTIPNSVLSIADYAFTNNLLTNLSIPGNVLELGEAAFNNNNLSDEEAFIFNRYDSDDDGIAEVYNEYLISYAGAKKENVEIPNTVQEIGRYAFSGTNLESVTIPNSVLSIAKYAFSNNLLTSISIPSSVTDMGWAVFNNNKTLDSEAFIYERTDSNADGVAEINTSKIISYSGQKRSNIVIPSSATVIGNDAFNGNNLENIIIPSTITSIYPGAFGNNKLTYACIKGKSSPADFSNYLPSIWNYYDSWATTENIIWNCNY